MFPIHKRTALILAALAGLLLMIGVLVLSASRRAEMLNETNETRLSVEASLSQLLPQQVSSASDAALLDAARGLAKAPYVARVWVVDDAGKIVFHQGGPGKEGDEVRALSGRDGRALVAALSSDVFSGPQALQIYTASALMAEGEHNDVYRPLVRSLQDESGRVRALVGLSYDVTPSVSEPPAGEMALTGLFLLGLGGYWLSLPLWTYLDARGRGEPAVQWSAFVLLANLVGLVAYLIVINRR